MKWAIMCSSNLNYYLYFTITSLILYKIIIEVNCQQEEKKCPPKQVERLLHYLDDVGQDLEYVKSQSDSDNLMERLNQKLEIMQSTEKEVSKLFKFNEQYLERAKQSIKHNFDDFIKQSIKFETCAMQLSKIAQEPINFASSLKSTWNSINELKRFEELIDHDRVLNVTLTAMLDTRLSIGNLCQKVVDTKKRLLFVQGLY